MAYTPTVWETGDVITAEKLNKAEQGIADASNVVFPITVTYAPDGRSATLDKALDEIDAAFSAGKPFAVTGGFIFVDLYYDNNEVVGVTVGQTGVNQSDAFNVKLMNFTDVEGVLTWTAPI